MGFLFTRRGFFSGALLTTPLARFLENLDPGIKTDSRAQTALEKRNRAAARQRKRPVSLMITNGDEVRLPNRIAVFAKGLPQNQYGEVDTHAYDAMLAALKTQKHDDFERLPRGGGRRLSNPQAAFTFHLEGGDPHAFEVSPPPSITSVEVATETEELYWQAQCRDIPFADYHSAAGIQESSRALKSPIDLVFRGPRKCDSAGPYISQFLLKPIPIGSSKIEQKYHSPASGSDFLTTTSEWSQIQSGVPPWREAQLDTTPRYIRSGRDLAEFVHYDFPYQAYLNAALILFNSGPKSILNCNPFKSPCNPYIYSTIQEGFVTFGQAEVTDWLGRVTTAALKAAYCQKWMVHRRLRPEALGGMVHYARTGSRKYPIHPLLLNSAAVDAVFSMNGSYLLPQAYPEGSPLHPAYPSGHAAIAGACSVILKVCFDGSMLLPGCVDSAPDGLSLLPCENYHPTVGDEINKLAFNVAMGRSWAGIHYRSDSESGLHLGEDVAISILQDLSCCYTEDFKGFSFKRINGNEVHITSQGEVIEV